jgi:hypothetical protein
MVYFLFLSYRTNFVGPGINGTDYYGIPVDQYLGGKITGHSEHMSRKIHEPVNLPICLDSKQGIFIYSKVTESFGFAG